jgi:arylsulfatase A-like enzyme
VPLSARLERPAPPDTIQEHGWAEFGKWHLGVDDEAGDETKARYTFPYGDFEKVHRCGLLAAESRSGQYEHFDIELAVAHLHGMLEMAAEVSRV